MHVKKVSILPPVASGHKISACDMRKISALRHERRSRSRSTKSVASSHSSWFDNIEENFRLVEWNRPRHNTLLGLHPDFSLQHYSALNVEYKEQKRRSRASAALFSKTGWLSIGEAIPVLPYKVACVCMFLNIVFPGLGTFASAFASLLWPAHPNMRKRRCEIFSLNVLASLLQLLTIIYLLIGYFWGIAWGVFLVQKADRARLEKRMMQEQGARNWRMLSRLTKLRTPNPKKTRKHPVHQWSEDAPNAETAERRKSSTCNPFQAIRSIPKENESTGNEIMHDEDDVYTDAIGQAKEVQGEVVKVMPPFLEEDEDELQIEEEDDDSKDCVRVHLI